MGLLAEAFRGSYILNLLRQPASTTINAGQAAQAGLANASYQTYAREGYAKNETVFAAIELRATSAAEPRIIGRRRKRGGQVEEVYDHPLLTILNKPNPFMSRAGLYSTLFMDRDLAGNSYLLKARGDVLGNVQELWRLRPDRVQVVPVDKHDPTAGIQAYLYRSDKGTVELPPKDVIHFKTRHPLDDWYGMPPMMALSGRIDIDNYMKDFVKSFFQNAGVPSGVLSTKQKLNQDAKDQLRTRFRNQFGGPAGWHELLVIDANETTYTPMTMQMGQRGLVIPELSNINEAHVAMVYGVPASILGAMVGLESSSYANKRSDWQVFWDVTMTPLFREFSDVLTMALVPEFGGIDEVIFDLSDIRALQEDVDKIADRDRKDLAAGAMTVEEYRAKRGMEPLPAEGTFLVPTSSTPTRVGSLGEPPEPAPAAIPAPASTDLLPAAPIMIEQPKIAEVRCPVARQNRLGEETHALLATNIERGQVVYCRHCKENHIAGGPIDPKVLRRFRVERDTEGALVGVVEQEG